MVEERRSPGKENRGNAQIIGLVLLIGMVFAGAMLVFLAGNTLLDDVSGQSDGDRAELSMLEAKSELETLAYQDDAPTTLHVEDGEVVEDGEIEFRVNGTDAGGNWQPNCRHTVELGSLVGNHEGEGDVRYQAGGVWRTVDETSTMVSRPNLRYRTETVNGTVVPSVRFPIMTIEGNVGAGDQYVARENASGMDEDEFRTALCLEGDDAIHQIHELEITIRDTSTIDAWERYAQSEFDDDNATVEGVDEGESGAVTITVNWDPVWEEPSSVGEPIEGAIYGGLWSNGGDVSLSDNQYTVRDSEGNPDWITIGDDLDFGGSVSIDGYLSVDGEVVRKGNAGTCPDVLFAASSRSEGADACDVDGEPDFEPVEPIDDQIEQTLDALADGPADDPTVAGTLNGGQYYTTDELDLSGTIDTTDGDVEIGVNDSNIVVSDLEIDGPGEVRIYTSGDVRIEGTTTGHDSDSLWIYGKGDSDVRFGQDSSVDFTGVVYAPGDGSSALTFMDQTHIEGAVVGGILGARGNSDVHIDFDDSLRSTFPIDDETAASATLEFLTHEVAEEVEVTQEAREVTPLDTVFVLDRSGSMGPPPGDLHYFVEYDAGHYEQIYEGEAADSPLRNADGEHETEVEQRTPRHRIYIADGDEWVYVEESQFGPEIDRDWGSITYDIPDDRKIRVTEAGFDPAGVRFDATENLMDSTLNASLDDRAGYVDFASDGQTRQSLTTTYDDVRDAFDEETAGGTDIGAGLREGASLYDDRDSDRVMVLLSDGQNSDSSNNEDTIEAAEAAAEDNITIYTIGLGEEADDEHLGNIASVTGGEYYYADDTDELMDRFDELREVVGDRTERYIEHKDVETRVGTRTIDGDTYDLSPGEPQNITFISYDCATTNSTGDAEEHDGKTYDHHECEDRNESGAHEINESVETSYNVYEDDDDLVDYDGGWWQTALSESLRDEGLIDGDDDFVLAENERVIAVNYEGPDTPTGYAVFKLTMHQPSLPPDGSTSSPPSNTYVISMYQTQITIES
ncbi:vWA domain-containing protein [Halomontanus rarus]|uniref:vWA domain-containing protein n=1 Tax=Halomontanus rarus TaxID=3034020 RepID=UPI0023E8F8EF|nr:vWA domain-containing protein [Halovivax sp. TS33]